MGLEMSILDVQFRPFKHDLSANSCALCSAPCPLHRLACFYGWAIYLPTSFCHQRGGKLEKRLPTAAVTLEVHLDTYKG